jgi:catechol 2,3-dioxygenase-like lactoylglutathione lyase family enzyme
MLKDSKVSAIAPAADLERARRFYADSLGLTPAEETPGGLTYHLGGGSELFLYATEYAGQAGHTVAAFRVRDIAAEVEGLESRGVQFETYDMPDVTWDGVVASNPEMGKVAWFKDSEGNILALDEAPISE